MAYKNKKSAKRNHRKYRRRSKKGGVITYNRNPNNLQATRKHQQVDESDTIRKLADSVTEKALANAIFTFSRQPQPQPQPINVTVHGKSRAKREGPTPGQIKKAEQKALKKQLKEQEKALKKELKEKEKAEKEQNKLHTKVAKNVTESAIAQAFSSMFGKGIGPKSRRRK